MKKTVRDVEWAGKTAVVRCDFNVPMQNGTISDETRIVAALPTIQYLHENGAKVVLMSHMGRPKGEPKPEFSLAPVAERLSEHLGFNVHFLASDVVVDDGVKAAVKDLKAGEVALLQNVRYRNEET
ncbi:MAG: phosphoglycerate kinase, partial [Eubacteriales bacterium]|nr:phosphoglycerate kinase [Eubacteriales bacterium]